MMTTLRPSFASVTPARREPGWAGGSTTDLVKDGQGDTHLLTEGGGNKHNKQHLLVWVRWFDWPSRSQLGSGPGLRCKAAVAHHGLDLHDALASARHLCGSPRKTC